MQHAMPTAVSSLRRASFQRPRLTVQAALDSLPWGLLVGYGVSQRSLGEAGGGVCMLLLVWLLRTSLLVGVFGWGVLLLGPAGLLVRGAALVALLLRVALEQAQHRRTEQSLRTIVQAEAHLRGLFAGTAHNIKHPLTALHAQLRVLDQAAQGTPGQMALLLQATLPRLHDQVAEVQTRVAQTLDLVRQAVLPLRARQVTLGTLHTILQPMLEREQQTLAPVLQLAVRCEQPEAHVWD